MDPRAKALRTGVDPAAPVRFFAGKRTVFMSGGSRFMKRRQIKAKIQCHIAGDGQ